MCTVISKLIPPSYWLISDTFIYLFLCLPACHHDCTVCLELQGSMLQWQTSIGFFYVFLKKAEAWIPHFLLNCYSLCLTWSGMCFGKFSTPLRPSRKTEALWLLQQNASLASARLMPHKQRSVCLWDGVQGFYFWLTHIMWSPLIYEVKSYWFFVRRQTCGRTASPQLTPSCEPCYCKGMIGGEAEWKHLGSDFWLEAG